MLQNILNKIKNFEPKTKIIMKYGFLSALIVSVISCLILFTYELFYSSPELYYIGLQVFKMSQIIAISFFVCGFAVDTIKKQMT